MPFEILLASEQGASVDHYLKMLSVAPAAEMRSNPAISELTIEKWTDAFLIFMAIHIKSHPADAPALLHYAHQVRAMARNMPSPL